MFSVHKERFISKNCLVAFLSIFSFPFTLLLLLKTFVALNVLSSCADVPL